MSSRLLFVYNNLKVNYLILGDQPYPGFDVLTYENQSFVRGSLYHLGSDAGFTCSGHTKVWGQIWISDTDDSFRELQEFVYPEGNIRPVLTKATILEKNEQGKVENIEVPVVVFTMTKVPMSAPRIDSGDWDIQRIKL
jgi:gamma-glutamylcyclotransferase (GGCT)/AIG2-like uncharacterized protein YtfP